MANHSYFLDNYIEWSKKEEFKSFRFIKKITEKTEKRLRSHRFNFKAFLLGPIYYFYLKMPFKALQHILLYFFACYALTSSNFKNIAYLNYYTIYILIAFLIGIKVDAELLKKLKYIFEKYKRFKPTADTEYFNISPKKLKNLVLLTGGGYILYWTFKNLKNINEQQNIKKNALIQTILFPIYTPYIFKAIAFSFKSVIQKKQIYKPKTSFKFFVISLSFILSFLFIILKIYKISQIKVHEINLTIYLESIIVLYVIFLSSLYWCAKTLEYYQKTINAYAENKNYPLIESFTKKERIFISICATPNIGIALIIYHLIKLQIEKNQIIEKTISYLQSFS